jgi:hypothetical protein
LKDIVFKGFGALCDKLVTTQCLSLSLCGFFQFFVGRFKIFFSLEVGNEILLLLLLLFSQDIQLVGQSSFLFSLAPEEGTQLLQQFLDCFDLAEIKLHIFGLDLDYRLC